MSKSPSQPSRGTYPLALLFLVCTVAAVMAAVVRPLLRVADWDDLLGGLSGIAIAFVISLFCGCLLGMIVGLYQFHRSWGVLSGLAIGAVLGPLAGLLLTADSSALQSLIPTVLIGSLIVLLVAWFTRPPERIEEEVVYDAMEVPKAVKPPIVETPGKNPFAD